MKKFMMMVLAGMLIVSAGCTMPWHKQQTGHGSASDLDLLNGFDQPSGADKQQMITCLKDKNVTFYGGASCNFSCERVAQEGNDMKNFACIDCDQNKELCDAIGIEQLPAWINPDNGQTEYDIMSLKELAKAFDCY